MWKSAEKELFGTVKIPKWLDTIIGKDPLKTSLELARDTKTIVGNALVLNPRVHDAQLVAAFTAANNLPHKESPYLIALRRSFPISIKSQPKPKWKH